MVRVACAQLAPVLGDAEGNLARSAEAIDAAAAGVVVLPELALSGYVFESVEEARALATPLPVLEEAWSRPGVVVVGGFLEAGATAGCSTPRRSWTGTGSGPSTARRICGTASPSSSRRATSRRPWWRRRPAAIAPLVCFDLFFPEWVRVAALAGAQLLCVCGNWPRGPRPFGRPVQLLRAMVAAEASGAAVATCDRSGDERGARWAGATGIAAPDGTLLAAAAGYDPETVAADVELLRGPPVRGRAAARVVRAARRGSAGGVAPPDVNCGWVGVGQGLRECRLRAPERPNSTLAGPARPRSADCRTRPRDSHRPSAADRPRRADAEPTAPTPSRRAAPSRAAPSAAPSRAERARSARTNTRRTRQNAHARAPNSAATRTKAVFGR